MRITYHLIMKYVIFFLQECQMEFKVRVRQQNDHGSSNPSFLSPLLPMPSPPSRILFPYSALFCLSNKYSSCFLQLQSTYRLLSGHGRHRFCPNSSPIHFKSSSHPFPTKPHKTLKTHLVFASIWSSPSLFLLH